VPGTLRRQAIPGARAVAPTSSSCPHRRVRRPGPACPCLGGAPSRSGTTRHHEPEPAVPAPPAAVRSGRAIPPWSYARVVRPDWPGSGGTQLAGCLRRPAAPAPYLAPDLSAWR
jgi:hypothetical protein